MYIAFGEEAGSESNGERSAVHSELLAACRSNSAFEVVELRTWNSEEVGVSDVVVVDCVNDQVPTRNVVGVRSRERLALVLPRDLSKAPQVRALRETFPVVMHLNHVPDGEPASLCIYFEPWSHVRRAWTPQRFLQRILVWLTGTATGTLHRDDQPIEAMYFESPIDAVLPPDWEKILDEEKTRVLVLAPVQRDANRYTLRGLIVSPKEAQAERLQHTVAIRVRVRDVVHSGVERFPATLGELATGLERRGASLLQPLVAEIRRLADGVGAGPTSDQECLLILSVPTKRTADGPVESTVLRGFKMARELWELGVQTGALSEHPIGGKYFAVPVLGEELPSSGKWKEVPLVPIAVKESVTRDAARITSAVPSEGADDARVLAGVGALGSAMLDLWTRERWGEWTLVDPDFLQPHNVVRHLARDCHVGHYKVDVVKSVVDSTYPLTLPKATPFRGDVLTTTEPRLIERLKEAVLLVDATTTLEVPRELARRDDVPRSASVFLTPSGRASTMLLEDDSRGVRLDELEAQYYGAILAEEWGADHLAGHQGELWVGAGCRDISAVLSNALVQLHASILTRQVRRSSFSPDPKISVWIADDATSGVRAVEVAVQDPIREKRDAWTVVSHVGISAKLNALRAAKLPSETGGLIVGYMDHPLKRIFVVDVLPAPSDSEGTPFGFVRGADGLLKVLDAIRDRTAGIVDYLGEWHSHPPFHTPCPSGDDVNLLAHCATVLARDGVPALMVIVGTAGEISYSLGLRSAPNP